MLSVGGKKLPAGVQRFRHVLSVGQQRAWALTVNGSGKQNGTYVFLMKISHKMTRKPNGKAGIETRRQVDTLMALGD